MKTHVLKAGLCLAVVVLAGVTGPTQAQTADALFTNVTETAGVTFTHTCARDRQDLAMGTGAAWLDYDRDGDLDLYVTQGYGPNALFRNDGGTFTDVAETLNAADHWHFGSGVAVADFNNDGWPDLFLANADGDVLLKNLGGAGFEDISEAAGMQILGTTRGMSAAWGDYDNDGLLDLYVTNHMDLNGPEPFHQDWLYHNNGDETFTDVSNLLDRGPINGYGFIGGWTDFDNDGDLDLFLVNDCGFIGDKTPNGLLRNDGGTDPLAWTFTDVAESAGVSACHNGMGLAVGDYNRDGWLDYYHTDIGVETPFYRNQGGTFQNVSEDLGIQPVIAQAAIKDHWSWGTNLFDYDLDGWLDLYITGGTVSLRDSSKHYPHYNLLFKGDGTAFMDVSPQSGLNDPGRSRTSVLGDYDGDGDLDLYLVNADEEAYLFRNNNPTGHHWLIVDLEGTVSNRDGIGARLSLTTPDGGTQIFETRSGSSLGGGDDIAAHFGLGDQAMVSTLEIRWPSGIVQTLTDVPANQRLKVVEDGTGVATEDAHPSTPYLLEAYPNPFTQSTRIQYHLPTPGAVRLQVFDALGRPVRTLAEGPRPAGTHHAVFDAEGLAAGVYLLRLDAEGTAATHSVVVR